MLHSMTHIQFPIRSENSKRPVSLELRYVEAARVLSTIHRLENIVSRMLKQRIVLESFHCEASE